jgi:hypothetical protein
MKYHIPEALKEALLRDPNNVPDEKLRVWATDQNCAEMSLCAEMLAQRTAPRNTKPIGPQDALFDPRTEISADARHIVKHLWILFVLLPFIFGLLVLVCYFIYTN